MPFANVTVIHKTGTKISTIVNTQSTRKDRNLIASVRAYGVL